MLSLSEALRTNRLEEFIARVERQGVGDGVTQADFDEAVRRLATQPRPEDRTSRFRRLGGLTGK